MNVNVSLMVESIVQIKSGITMNVNGSIKIQKIYYKYIKNIFGILLHVVLKMVNI